MDEIDLSNWSPSDTKAPISSIKKRTLLIVTLVCFAVYTPLTIINIMREVHVVSTLNIAFLAVLTFTATCKLLKRDIPDLLIYTVLLFLALSSTAPIYYVGMNGALWIFPIVTSLFFVLNFRLALISSIAMICMHTALSFYVLNLGFAVRLLIALITTLTLVYFLRSRILQMQHQLRKHSTTDPMTGAYNRRMLSDMLEDAVTQFERYETPAVIAMFDIDNFKIINDTKGHHAGDKAIVELVALVRKNSRKSDLVFRLGGDEIMLLLRNITEQDASALLEKIRLLVVENDTIGTTVSIGAAPLCPELSSGMWLKKTDQALYRAKENGRNQLVFSPSPSDELRATVNG